MAGRSSNFRMADKLIGGNLATLLADLRAQGQSFEQVAYTLRADYGIEVTSVTARAWVRQLEAEAKATEGAA